MKSKKTIQFEINSIIIWLRVLQDNRFKNNEYYEILEIDLLKVRFLEPSNIVSLSVLIEEYYSNGSRIEFVNPQQLKVNNYLKNIRFYEYWNADFDRNMFTPVKITTTLCLWKISQTMIYSYANAVQNYFQDNYFKNKDLAGLHVSIIEVFNNIFDHSLSPTDGYVLTQYYPNNSKIKTSICDFGIGIPNKINQKWIDANKKKLSDSMALRLALRLNYTSKSNPRNRGFGLDILLGFINELNGKLEVNSNKSQLLLNARQPLKILDVVSFFGGTLIDIEIDTENFPIQEVEIVNEEFIF